MGPTIKAKEERCSRIQGSKGQNALEKSMENKQLEEGFGNQEITTNRDDFRNDGGGFQEQNSGKKKAEDRLKAYLRRCKMTGKRKIRQNLMPQNVQTWEFSRQVRQTYTYLKVKKEAGGRERVKNLGSQTKKTWSWK